MAGQVEELLLSRPLAVLRIRSAGVEEARRLSANAAERGWRAGAHVDPAMRTIWLLLSPWEGGPEQLGFVEGGAEDGFAQAQRAWEAAERPQVPA
jgi:hypothetical protein